MASCRKLGETVIDELRLCYTAEPSLLEVLRNCHVAEQIDFEDFYMIRVCSRYFRTAFLVCQDSGTGGRKQLATLQFDRMGDNDSNYIWYYAENWVLYDPETLKYFFSIPRRLKLCFNNFTVLDLAKDFKKNITHLIRRLYKNKTITTIVNGKAVKDRKQVIPEFHIAFEVSLDRLRYPTFYAKQRKALHDKTKGVCVSSYNKKAEIEDASSKEYILDFYNNPKTLHRLEVHINSTQIRDYCRTRGIVQCTDLLFDKEFLSDLYFYHLASVLRFTQGRQRLDWKGLLNLH